jgi:hypothetical protein
MKKFRAPHFVLIILLSVSHCYADNGYTGVPQNIAELLNTLNTTDDNYQINLIEDGTIELNAPDNKVTFYPFLFNTDINYEEIGSEIKFYDNSCVSFGKNNIEEILYCPIDLSINSYPTFVNTLSNIDSGLTIPYNISLPPGTILPDNVEYNNSIPFYSLKKLLNNNPSNKVEFTSEGIIIINDISYFPFYGLVGTPGHANSNASAHIDVLENGTLAIPDGSLLIPFTIEPNTQQILFSDDAYPDYNPEDNSYTLVKGSYSEKFNLNKTQSDSDDSDPINTHITIYPDIKPEPEAIPHEYFMTAVFLNSTNNNDGTFTLSDGTQVYNPPIIDNNFSINTLNGLPVFINGIALTFDYRGLPINPLDGKPFIPGKNYINTNFIHLDKETNFPLDPYTLLPIDPYTGLTFISGKGFILNEVSKYDNCERLKNNIKECIDGTILIIDEIDFDDFLFE